MKKIVIVFLLIGILFSLSGCYASFGWGGPWHGHHGGHGHYDSGGYGQGHGYGHRR